MHLIPRLPIPAVVAAGLVVAGVALQPGIAAAACGDYVIVQKPADTGDPAPHPATPCHGPGCSKAPAAPLAPVTAPVRATADSDHLSAVVDSGVAGASRSQWAYAAAEGDRPVQAPAPIFHPPRAH